MLYAIISDVHANLEAVDACFERIDEIKPDRIICLGDIVDYCAEPNEVTDVIRARCDVVVLGNHDEAQFHYERSDGFSESARISSVHTRSVISYNHVSYFKSLPHVHSEENLLFVHSSPADPAKYHYILTPEKAKLNFESFTEQICFIGHSHIPVIFRESKEGVLISGQGHLDKKSRYIINVGSVGQPRDRDPRLCFGLFDSSAFTFRYERVTYDLSTASVKILAEGLPIHLAERLSHGI